MKAIDFVYLAAPLVVFAICWLGRREDALALASLLVMSTLELLAFTARKGARFQIDNQYPHITRDGTVFLIALSSTLVVIAAMLFVFFVCRISLVRIRGN